MLRLLPIPELPSAGLLYLSSMPGRCEPLDDFVSALREDNVRHVVCLVSDEEIYQKSPTYHAAINQQQIPGEIWRFPIPDYGIPRDQEELDLLLDRTCELLEQGRSVVIHCAAGHGRTGIVAILLLARMGVELGEATRRVKTAGSGPDTEAQRQFLTMRANPDRAQIQGGRTNSTD